MSPADNTIDTECLSASFYWIDFYELQRSLGSFSSLDLL